MPLGRPTDYHGLTEEYAMEGSRMFENSDRRAASQAFGESQRKLQSNLGQAGQGAGQNPFASRQAINAVAGAQTRGIAQGQQLRGAEDIQAAELAQQQWARELGLFTDQQLRQQQAADRAAEEQAKQQALNELHDDLQAQGVGMGVSTALGALSGIGGAAGMSDIRAKEDVRPAGNMQDETLSDLDGYNYQYRDGMGLPEGKRYGIMAQDLEKSPIGDTLVSEDSQGLKRIDTTGAVPAILGLLGRVTQRLEKLEGGRASKF